jgi:hypothetical protein
MNQNKARDFFSAYYEGSLEGGLKQSFESTLRSDANLRSDYAAFVETVEELDMLKHEVIEIPIFLSDRIASRLEEVQTKQKVGFPIWTNWIKGFAVAGLAAVAIVGALPLLNGSRSVGTSQFLPGASNLDQIQFKADGSKLTLEYQPSASKTVVVSSAISNKEIQRFNLDGQRLECPIENSFQTASIFKIEVLGDKASNLVALPGKTTAKAKASEGSVQDLALALSGHYRVPVLIEAADVTKHVSWNFTSADARSAASQAVEPEGFSVDQRQDGLIEIMDR